MTPAELAVGCQMCHGAHLVGGGLTLPCPACDLDNQPVPGWEPWYRGERGLTAGPEQTEVDR